MDEPAAGVFQVEKPVWKRNCLHTTWRSPPRLPIVYKRCLQMVSSNLDRCVAVQLSFSSWRGFSTGLFFSEWPFFRSPGGRLFRWPSDASDCEAQSWDKSSTSTVFAAFFCSLYQRTIAKNRLQGVKSAHFN